MFFISNWSILKIMKVSIDNFLGGKVRLKQSVAGYRATSDSVLLASGVLAKSGQSVLDVGCAGGVVSFCLQARVKNLNLTGVDIQDDLIMLANENNLLNNATVEFLLADILKKNEVLKGLQFDHVVTNPPFYANGRGRDNEEQRKAFHETESIEKWIRACAKYVKAKGSLTLIHRADAIPEILSAFQKTALGGIQVIPLVKDLKTPAKRVIVRGFLGSKKPFELKNPFVLHKENGEGYTDQADAILRIGMALDDYL